MFDLIFSIIFRSIKLDKTLYRNNKNFGEPAVYIAGLIMILDGIAGAFAASTIIKTNIALSGLTALFTWFIWSIIIYIIGVKIFPEKNTKTSFKKILSAVGFAHSPGLLRFLAFSPEIVIPLIFITQFWIFASLIVAVREILTYKSNFKSTGVVLISFLIIAFVSISLVITRLTALSIN